MQTSYGYLCFFVAVFLLELLDAASSVNGLLLSSIKWMTARTYFNVQDIFTDSRASIKGVATTTNNFCVVVFWVNICFHGYSQKMLIVKFYRAEVYLLRREPAREFRCQVSTIDNNSIIVNCRDLTPKRIRQSFRNFNFYHFSPNILISGEIYNSIVFSSARKLFGVFFGMVSY